MVAEIRRRAGRLEAELSWLFRMAVQMPRPWSPEPCSFGYCPCSREYDVLSLTGLILFISSEMDRVVHACQTSVRFDARRQAMRLTRVPLLLSFRTTLFPTLFAIVFLQALAGAQAGPKYDPATEMKLKGTIEELKFPPKGSEKEIAHLMIKNGTDLLDIYLCPKAFMDDMGVSFAKGDEIAFTGSKVKGDLILAREVVKGTDTLVLRDEKGNPVWGWRK